MQNLLRKCKKNKIREKLNSCLAKLKKIIIKIDKFQKQKNEDFENLWIVATNFELFVYIFQITYVNLDEQEFIRDSQKRKRVAQKEKQLEKGRRDLRIYKIKILVGIDQGF